MNPVRVGIIGMGNMGRHHAQALLSGEVARCTLTAVCRDKTGLCARPGIASFEKSSDLIRSGLVDAVIVATPHFSHPEIAADALENGLHVLVEKPIAAHKADAERLLSVHQQHKEQVFAAMFQLRTEPRYARIKSLLSEGQLGGIIRFSWIATDWFRTQAYYSSSHWRATWKGEGGGVLLNQCPHQLDLLQWLMGMPVRLRSFVQLGRYHEIEVEDSVTAYLEFPQGVTGVFITSTGEAPGANRFEIAGTLGKLVLENDTLTLTHNTVSSAKQIQTASLGFSKPASTVESIPFSSQAAQHVTVLRNFVDAIESCAPLIAPGAEGIRSLELANAMLYSGLMDQTISLPLDSAAYGLKLRQLIAESRFVKRVVSVSDEDFSSSFKK